MKTFKFNLKLNGKDSKIVSIKKETYFEALNILRSIYPLEDGYSSTLISNENN